MSKFFRVKEDNFMWKKGAILQCNSQGHCTAIEDIWNATPILGSEYISLPIVEAPENARFFERIYENSFAGKCFKTADELREFFNTAFGK
jgi:hypothetical protein